MFEFRLSREEHTRKFLLSFLIFFLFLQAHSQTDDSLSLEEVSIHAYLDKQPVLRVPASVTILDSAALNAYPGQSLVAPFNAVAGVRMEERSPMSYRLSIRGSLLRSPFGIRNVKIYMDEFPLTDAGGNSYLNLIDLTAIHNVEVLKGPNGSIFGANSGGVVRLDVTPLPPDSFRISANAGTGSYGLWHEHLKFEKQAGKHFFTLSESVQRSDGYRENSAAQRICFQATENWKYTPRAEIRALFFYSDLGYGTPGGLTLQQWEMNPRASRPATATLPGAWDQKAGVHNSTFYGGILHERKIGNHLRHVIALFGSHTDFENPFITNFETRSENTTGMRSWIEAKNDASKNFAWKADLGLETQKTFSAISNYQNLSGNRGTLQDKADVNIFQNFIFTRLALDLYHRVFIEGAVSLNSAQFSFSSTTSASGFKSFVPQFMPRLAVSVLLTQSIAWRASAGKGYSPPTLAEIRSSDNIINTDLQPETGWNYETGFRFREKEGRAQWDVCAFYYQLNQAIVRRLNDNGDEYFVNAGGTKQVGIELQTTTRFLQRQNGFIRKLQLSNGTSFSNFIFSNYVLASGDYSGNRLTGVPEATVVTGLETQFPQNITLFIGHNYTSAIPLNDGNTVFANDYHLMDIKIGWTYSDNARFQFGVNAGINNLLDEKYSLGNDLNTAGGRYYNAAPGRNYFVRMFVRFV
ncbi:MAG: TonB-dependent receptor [Bacteroidota bacterium]|nr:TonB-dependent receptor [Bacteroidota bacterium]